MYKYTSIFWEVLKLCMIIIHLAAIPSHDVSYIIIHNRSLLFVLIFRINLEYFYLKYLRLLIL